MDAKTLIDELLSAGLTQMEIERRSGVDQSTISGIKTGKRGKRPAFETVDALKRLRDSVVRASKRKAQLTAHPEAA
ncbi:helix-turn-helix domain-containing protein [Paraburkholderia bannensis]|uniref:helix-turn-helix domain-containing protein n=1 Tax=Paraburkholderia bannensis TaxID=765414 RepID=UPI002ABE907B|nr:helix-turn-helix domain-containing protein [Paraburkholderia bannensis]